MADTDSSSRDSGGTDRGVNRRTVLKGVGTGAMAGVGLIGTASGHEVRGKPVFCGCTQLCVCVDGNADVLMAQETENGYDVGFVVGGGELDPYPQGEPRYSGNFCVSTDDDAVPDGKIIGLQVAGTRWVNPNECAQDALEAERAQLDSTHQRPAGDSGDNCENPPCNDSGGENGAGDIEVTWENCETVSVTGNDGALDAITVHSFHCFPGAGPCPDDNLGITIENPDLPLTIDDQYLDTDDVPYYHWAVELEGDVEQDRFAKPDDLDCSFETERECETCESGTDLLEQWAVVKTDRRCYFERETDKGNDPNIHGVDSFTVMSTPSECEPFSVTFNTSYCSGTLDAVVEAGSETVTQENLTVSDGRVTVTNGSLQSAIESVRFYCTAPDDESGAQGTEGQQMVTEMAEDTARM